MRLEEYTVSFLAELLNKRGLLTQEQVRICIGKESAVRTRVDKDRHDRHNARRLVRYESSPAEIVAHMAFESSDKTAVDEDRIMEVIAWHAQVPYRKIDPLKLDADLIADFVVAGAIATRAGQLQGNGAAHLIGACLSLARPR